MKKLCVGILALTLTCSCLFGSTKAFADTNEQAKENVTYESVSKQYNLEDIAIPEGVTPITVNSPEELELKLQEIKNAIDAINEAPTTVEGDINEAPSINLRSKSLSLEANSPYSYTKEVSSSKGIGNLICNFKVWGTVTVEGYSTDRFITNVMGENCGLTGVTFGSDLVGPKATSRIYNNKRSVDIVGSGTLNTYIMVSGVGKIFSNSISHTCTYSI